MVNVYNFQVSFTPNGMDMRMLQPCDAPLRRHFLPGVKVEYSVSPRQSAYRVQIHRIQVKTTIVSYFFGLNVFVTSTKILRIFACSSFLPYNSFTCASFPRTDSESAARSHLPLRFLPCKTAKVYHHGRRSVNLSFI